MNDRSLIVLGAEHRLHAPAHAKDSDAEFPAGAELQPDPISRREMLKIMAASAAMAGFSGCDRQPPEHIVPRAYADPRIVPGVPLYFATAVSRDGYGIGVLVQSHSGRPLKIEGNPQHPSSLGRTDAFTQAETLSFYDPDRSQTVFGGGAIATWDDFERALRPVLEQCRAAHGAGLRILTGHLTSPTLLEHMGRLLHELPGARWHVHEPIHVENARQGAHLALGRPAEAVYQFDQADVVFSLDSDFLFELPGRVRYAKDFSARRRVVDGAAGQGMSRLYVAEPTPTITGSKADHRLAIKRSQVQALAIALAGEFGALRGGEGESSGNAGLPGKWIREVAADLRRSMGRSIVLAGNAQPPLVHALCFLINEHLGNIGRTLFYIEPIGPSDALRPGTLEALARDIAAGEVTNLVVLDSNPVYTAPADLEFADRIREVRFSVHMGLHRDETGRLAMWHLPMHHPLESWGDIRAHDGTVTILQPLIQPLYESRSAVSLLATLRGVPTAPDRERIREYWRSAAGAGDFERWWRESLQQGYVAQSQARPISAAADRQRIETAVSRIEAAAGADSGLFEVCFTPDGTLWDGRYANHAWLQEIPKPITKMTWDNAALISPGSAKALGLRNGQVIGLALHGRSVRAPVWILPGQVDGCISLSLGYGRTAAGRVGNERGFNAYALRRSGALWSAGGLTVEPSAETYALAVVQGHHQMQGRDLVRVLLLAEMKHTADSESGHAGRLGSMYPEQSYSGNQWGMVIDLTTCIGCNACTIACQAENNIPVVGKQQVYVGREMHWIRVDTYVEGPDDDPAFHHQPVPCMHCETAPCEVVCPVGATTHSHDGLNEMTYNRCIGTRYCSNNCPYKVRRFNFFGYDAALPPVERMYQNPQVTVRGRGVMEKCTYCVQRIRNTEIRAKREYRPIKEGELQTACQQVCPADAIIFGDLNDPASAVSVAARQAHNYALLAELNTRPRTTYLARINNRNPSLQS